MSGSQGLWPQRWSSATTTGASLYPPSQPTSLLQTVRADPGGRGAISFPWLARRLKRQSSGDEITPKRPELSPSTSRVCSRPANRSMSNPVIWGR